MNYPEKDLFYSYDEERDEYRVKLFGEERIFKTMREALDYIGSFEL